MGSLDTLFLSARNIEDPGQRAAYLAQACGSDADLRQRVETMLRDAKEANDFFGPEGTAVIGAPVTEGPGTAIGRYKLLQRIGEGGMGVVYMAEQHEPVIRRVALKIIKLGMDSKQVIRRFDTERQALALMDHPHIAKVFDGGTTETGRPYFVMELIQGLPITQFCDEANLPTRDRLELFLDICSAIQHAHQKGIIHRDLKPSNILVMLHGDKPVAKVIDFGVAKATQKMLTDKTIFTQFQQFIGTPAYMSPEQTSLSGLDVDTRSDIYALGVLLYELLTGKTPFDAKELMKAGFDEMRRTIREQEPPRPSTRLTELVAANVRRHSSKSEFQVPKSEAEIRESSSRLIQTKERIRLLRGDLDWIVMKCLEKDRARRYETANGLAADLRRHLNHEPVVARPPSAAYRLRKLARRNKAAFAAVTSVATVLILATLVSVSQWRKSVAREEITRQKLYSADMSLALEAVENRDMRRARALLERHPPAPGRQRDPPGWEWRYIWERSRSDELFSLGRHSSRVTAVAFSPADAGLVSASRDGEIKLWNVSTRAEVARYHHANGISDVRFSSDGSRLASAGPDGAVRFWQGTTLEPAGTPLLNSRPILRMELSADWHTLALGGAEEVRLWDVVSGHELGTVPESGSVIAFSPNGRWLAIADEHRLEIRLWDMTTKTNLGFLSGHRSRVLALAFSPDGSMLASASQDNTVKLWDLATRREHANMDGHTATVNRLAWSANGKVLASGSQDRTLRTWDVASRRPLATLCGHLDSIQAVALTADGKTLASGGSDGSVRIWNATGEADRAASLSLPSDIVGFSLSRDGRTLSTSHIDGACRIWDTPGLRQRAWFNPRLATLTGGAVANGGLRLASGEKNGSVRVWVPERESFRSLMMPTNHSEQVQSLAFAPDGNTLATVGGEGVLRLWDTEVVRQLASIALSSRSIVPGVFSHDSKSLVVGLRNGTLAVVNVAARRLETVLGQPRAGGISGVALSSDGSLAAVARTKGTIQLWHLSTRRLSASFNAPLLNLGCVALSPDGQRVAAGASDRTIRIWDARTQEEVGRLVGHKDNVEALAFLSDGDTLVSVSSEAIFVWRAATSTEAGFWK